MKKVKKFSINEMEELNKSQLQALKGGGGTPDSDADEDDVLIDLVELEPI